MVFYKSNENSKAYNNLPISNNLFSELQKSIITGELKSGAKLTEQSICKKYKVSRTPVREALRQLEVEGLVETIPNRGAFVVGFSQRDVEDMYELRKSYEILAVKWAILRISDEELEDLEETFEFMEFYTAKKDYEKLKNINMGFHQLIYNACGNRFLKQILSSYQIYTKYSKLLIENTNNYSENMIDSLNEHNAIFQAFKKKDVQAGMNAIEKHIVSSARRCGIYL